MSHENLHDTAVNSFDHGWSNDPAHFTDYSHTGMSDYNFNHDLQQSLFDLNDTSDGGNFSNDINHLIDEITAPPDLSHTTTAHVAGIGDGQFSSPSFNPSVYHDTTFGTAGLAEHTLPADAHSVGYDANGNWWSWGLDAETGIPTFAPDPSSFGMPISTTDTSDSSS